MGEKKQKEKSIAQWKKVVVVGACVLFVVLMIVSGMGMSWISAFAVVKPGDVVVVDYTLYDAGGNPIVTSDQTLFKTEYTQGHSIIYSKQISVTANQSLSHPLFPVQVYSATAGWVNQFAIFRPEYDAISSGIVGMKVNGEKRITIPSSETMTQLWSPELLQRNGVNLTTINIGDLLTMGVSDNPEEMASNTSTMTYMRVGEVSRKSTQGVVVDFGYPSVVVSIVSINGNQ